MRVGLGGKKNTDRGGGVGGELPDYLLSNGGMTTFQSASFSSVKLNFLEYTVSPLSFLASIE